jgi:hypothetical protein
MQPAFVIGNGPSRKPIDLKKLKKHGVTFGCNALYRDFTPDYLIANDKPMQDEILRAKPDCRLAFRATRSAQKQFSGVYYYPSRKGPPNNSGYYALYFACKQGFRNIYLLGFDFQHPQSKQVENLYRGTANYKSSPRYRTDTEVGMQQLIDLNPHITVTRVIDEALSYPLAFFTHTITVEQFNELYS